MLEANPDADVDEGQVSVEDVRAQRDDHDQPAGEGDGDEQKPRECSEAEVGESTGVQPASDEG